MKMKELFRLIAEAIHKKDCALQLYNEEVILHTGTGPERKCFSCNINNKDNIKKMRKLLK
jgi:hypothetical protein